MKKRLKLTAAAMVVGIFVAGLVLWPALRGVSRTPTETNADVVDKLFGKIEKVQSYFVEEKLKGALALSDEQTQTLMTILKESNEKRAVVIREKVAIVDQLEHNDLHGEALRAALEQMQALDHRFFALEQEKQDQLRWVLSDEQSAKYLVLRRQFVRKVLEVVKPLL